MLTGKKNESVLGIVPARSGSKGIPNKNIRLLAGVPLLVHAIKSGLVSGVVDRVLLTTDSNQFADIGRAAGAEVPFIRPPELAQDTTPMLPVIQHALRFVMEAGWTPDIVVLLQPTAPFRCARDLVRAIEVLRNSPDVDSAVTIEAMPDHYSPHFAFKIEGGKLLPFLPDGLRVTRRQDAAKSYTRNGQFYVMKRTTLLEKNSIYGQNCAPIVTSHKAVNLDTMDDWHEAEQLAKTFFAPAP